MNRRSRSSNSSDISGYTGGYIGGHARGYALLFACLVSLLILAACGGDETPTPTAAPTDTPIAAQAAAGTAAAAPTDTAPTGTATAPEPTLEPTATPVVSAGNGSTTVLSPLEVEQGTNCEIESHLDLSGYPNLEAMGCPVEDASLEPIAINEFGTLTESESQYDRFMLWFSSDRLIYVLFPDSTYRTYQDTWTEAEPEFSCNPLDGEADSPPLPRRGFGKLWCNEPEVQEALGTVPREERLCQHSVLQRFANGRLLACFEDATVRYFHIRDDGSWDLLQQ